MQTAAVNVPRIGEAEVIPRDDVGYEAARTGEVWNQRRPERFPEFIIRVTGAGDVVEALAFARKEGLRVVVRSGGHSMCGSSFRDGSMLIDLSRLRSWSVNVAQRTASVEPAVTGRELAAGLAAEAFAFPVGHCGSVPVGGYLLSGGLGWNLNSWGPAYLSVRGLEVVTADGQQLKVDSEENPDLYWAARGAGPGFFGVVTRFDLDLRPLPRAILSSTYHYPLSAADVVSGWVASVIPEMDSAVEMLLRLATTPAGPVIVVAASAFAASDAHAKGMLEPLEACPAMPMVIDRNTFRQTSFADLFDWTEAQLPRGHRYLEETIWSESSLPELISRLAEAYAPAPSPRSIVMLSPLYGTFTGRNFPDASFSMLARTFVLCYAIWNTTEDREQRKWMERLLASIEDEASGHYIAETDLAANASRAASCYSAEAWARLAELRSRYDPHRLFHTYLGEE